MQIHEVRKRYLDYMRSYDHAVIASSPLVPSDDATTLFTGSGMQPLVPYLLGREHPKGVRLANAQKCFRANDIDEVGDNRHTTFFEMLGNWSLGDYFKTEQIQRLFTFLIDTEVGIGLDPHRLYVTVFAGDEVHGIERDNESAEEWRKLFDGIGVDAGIAHIGSQEDGDRRGMRAGERIFFYDAAKNWWSRSGPPNAMPVGEPGGPDTEVFYDFGEECADSAYAHLKPHPNSDSGRFIEIGNSVFMEYLRTEGGFKPLPKRNVDFGGGLERLAAATEGIPDIFCLDVFRPCIGMLEQESGVRYTDRPKPFRVIADHLRSALFITADGVIPSNTDRGYVLRRLIREAMYNMKYALNINETFLSPLMHSIAGIYESYYPEVGGGNGGDIVEDEVRRFAATLERGTRVVDTLIEKGEVTGKDVFTLQSTYGFPKELTVALAEKRGVRVSLEGYEDEMKRHRDSSRASNRTFKGGLADTTDMSVKYHTATHLLLQALRDVLGDSVEQKGSNITPERLRLDFSYGKKMTDDEKEEVERIVNQKIQEKLPITCTDMPVEDARKSGAIGVFTYEDIVRVYVIGEYSKEICGGPHVDNTDELGQFSITKEGSVGSGVRRIRAVLE